MSDDEEEMTIGPSLDVADGGMQAQILSGKHKGRWIITRDPPMVSATTPDNTTIEDYPEDPPWLRQLRQMPAPRRTKTQAAHYAATSKHQQAAARWRRAAELQSQGLTRREIGERIAAEAGQPSAFPPETVKGWLANARRVRSSEQRS